MTQRRPPQRLPRAPLADPGRGGHLEYKDYTKFIQWTPRRIALFTICLVLPYVVAAIAVSWAIAPYMGLLMLAIPGVLGLLGIGFYWIVQKAL